MRFSKVLYADPRVNTSNIGHYIKEEFSLDIARSIVEKYMKIKIRTDNEYGSGVSRTEYSVTFDVFDEDEFQRILSEYLATGVF